VCAASRAPRAAPGRVRLATPVGLVWRSQKRASREVGLCHAGWDGEERWDVDDGTASRTRYTKTGTPIPPEYAHVHGKAHYQKGWGAYKLGKKVGGAVLRKVPCIGWGPIAYDIVMGGPEHALREATWPVSEAVAK
jgi:hypothetical protein